MSKPLVTSKFFKEAEFQKCSPPCSLQDMDQSFMNFLDRLRESSGIPLRITSAYRSVAHEKKNNRSGNSAHTEGKAVDIATPNSSVRYNVLKAAFAQNCKRIGINFEKNFIHVDTSTKLDQNVLWKY